MDTLRINNKYIGKDKPVFIIAEAGVNHNGDIELAKQLIDIAAEAGADAVKFQTYVTEELVSVDTPLAPYQKQNISHPKSQFEMLKKLEFGEREHLILRDYAAKKDLIFSSTPHSGQKDLELLEKVGVEFYKIGSGDLNNLPFLAYVAKLGRPMIISTGMSTLTEVMEAKKTVFDEGNKKIIFLHCTSSYPAKPESLNLNAIKTMKDSLGTLIGYSDHTIDATASIVAVILGATVLEKHITASKNLKGPDHKASLEPTQFKKYIQAIRLIENKNLSFEEAISLIKRYVKARLFDNYKLMLGRSIKTPTKDEISLAKVTRKGIYARHNLSVGTKISVADISIRRPEGFLKPKDVYGISNRVVGKIVKKDILVGEQIKLDDLS